MDAWTTRKHNAFNPTFDGQRQNKIFLFIYQKGYKMYSYYNWLSWVFNMTLIYFDMTMRDSHNDYVRTNWNSKYWVKMTITWTGRISIFINCALKINYIISNILTLNITQTHFLFVLQRNFQVYCWNIKQCVFCGEKLDSIKVLYSCPVF